MSRKRVKDSGEGKGKAAHARRTYVKPVLSSERIFETEALACGKCQGAGPYKQFFCFRYGRNS